MKKKLILKRRGPGLSPILKGLDARTGYPKSHALLRKEMKTLRQRILANPQNRESINKVESVVRDLLPNAPYTALDSNH